MERARFSVVAATLVLALGLAGCVETTQAGNGQSSSARSGHRVSSGSTAMQKAIGGCVASIGVGILIGALANKKNGALAGAVVGGAACAVLLQVAAAEDRARIAAEEAAALRTNKSRTKSFKTKSGKVATVRTKVRAVPVSVVRARIPTFEPMAKATSSNITSCRKIDQSVSVGGSVSQAPPQYHCRVAGGDYQAMP